MSLETYKLLGELKQNFKNFDDNTISSLSNTISIKKTGTIAEEFYTLLSTTVPEQKKTTLELIIASAYKNPAKKLVEAIHSSLFSYDNMRLIQISLKIDYTDIFTQILWYTLLLTANLFAAKFCRSTTILLEACGAKSRNLYSREEQKYINFIVAVTKYFLSYKKITKEYFETTLGKVKFKDLELYYLYCFLQYINSGRSTRTTIILLDRITSQKLTPTPVLQKTVKQLLDSNIQSDNLLQNFNYQSTLEMYAFVYTYIYQTNTEGTALERYAFLMRHSTPIEQLVPAESDKYKQYSYAITLAGRRLVQYSKSLKYLPYKPVHLVEIIHYCINKIPKTVKPTDIVKFVKKSKNVNSDLLLWFETIKGMFVCWYMSYMVEIKNDRNSIVSRKVTKVPLEKLLLLYFMLYHFQKTDSPAGSICKSIFYSVCSAMPDKMSKISPLEYYYLYDHEESDSLEIDETKLTQIKKTPNSENLFGYFYARSNRTAAINNTERYLLFSCVFNNMLPLRSYVLLLYLSILILSDNKDDMHIAQSAPTYIITIILEELKAKSYLSGSNKEVTLKRIHLFLFIRWCIERYQLKISFMKIVQNNIDLLRELNAVELVCFG